MSEVRQQTIDLVRAGKGAFRPTEADRERITQGLRERLGDATVLGMGAAAPFVAKGLTRATSSTASIFTGAGLVALIGGAALFYGLHSAPNGIKSASILPPPADGVVAVLPAHIENVAAHVSSQGGAAVVISSPSAATPPVISAGDNTVDATPAPRRRVRDSLSEEVAIMSRAATELHSGRAASAIKLLDEHERKFANGILAQERAAARIQALCALGKTADADAQLAHLARISPRSPLLARARQACREPASPKR